MLELLLKGPWGEQAIRGVGGHTEKSTLVEDRHVLAVLEVANVVWGGEIGQAVVKLRGLLVTVPFQR